MQLHSFSVLPPKGEQLWTSLPHHKYRSEHDKKLLKFSTRHPNHLSMMAQDTLSTQLASRFTWSSQCITCLVLLVSPDETRHYIICVGQKSIFVSPLYCEIPKKRQNRLFRRTGWEELLRSVSCVPQDKWWALLIPVGDQRLQVSVVPLLYKQINGSSPANDA